MGSSRLLSPSRIFTRNLISLTPLSRISPCSILWTDPLLRGLNLATLAQSKYCGRLITSLGRRHLVLPHKAMFLINKHSKKVEFTKRVKKHKKKYCSDNNYSITTKVITLNQTSPSIKLSIQIRILHTSVIITHNSRYLKTYFLYTPHLTFQ